MPDPIPPEFWTNESQTLFEILFPLMSEAAANGAENGLSPFGSVDLGVSWEAVNNDCIRWAEKYTAEVVSSISQTSMAAFEENFGAWVQSGEPLPALIEALTPFYGSVRAEMVAVTETTRAYASGNILAWQGSGMVDNWNVFNAEDALVCEICADVSSGNPYPMDADPPPYHVNCILPGNEVVIPDLIAASKSFYVGRCIEISMANGSRITVTPNHAILTPLGWVKAQFLHELDNVVIASNGERIAFGVNPDYEYRPAKIEQVFSSAKMISKMLPVSVESTAENFHGDGRNIHGDIEIVKVNSPLRSNVKLPLPQPASELKFNWSGVRKSALMGNRAPDLLSVTHDSVFGSRMSSLDLVASFPCGHPRPFQSLGFGLRTDMNAGGHKSFPHSPAIDSSRARDFVLRFASDIALDQIVKIRDFNYSGHVYDLQSEMYELYTCNGIIVSNCRCWLQPILSNEFAPD